MDPGSFLFCVSLLYTCSSGRLGDTNIMSCTYTGFTAAGVTCTHLPFELLADCLRVVTPRQR